MKYKFYVHEVPDPWPIDIWINKKIGVDELAKKIKPSIDITKLVTLNHSINIDELSSAVLEAVDKFGFKGWRSKEGSANHYGGLSITSNPNYIENVDSNAQTLGTEKNLANEFYYDSINNFKTWRNTYFDCYGYRQFSPCVNETKLKNILSKFKRSFVRSRIGIVNAEYSHELVNYNNGWHKDESIFKNLRINIPIQTDETFMWEMKDREPVHLSYGNIYTWDTNIEHRVFPTTKEPKTRTHLVLGFSPWFDYIPEEDAFVSNEFYGEMHPFDMLINGHVHEQITGVK